MHPGLQAALGTVFVLHLGVLLSLPSVLRNRGAPYLPTFKTSMDTMFKLVREHVRPTGASERGLTFVDLGSGDGRVVFRAAREGLFSRSRGFEINPVLHAFAAVRRAASPTLYWRSTAFFWGDFWKVSCADADVVAVYGLHPIMDRVGEKLREELQPGALVVSNVFQIPGWKQTAGGDGVHVYRVPCWAEDPAG
jgi:hypothetical protein